MKKLIIKRQLKVIKNNNALKTYPKSISNIGLFLNQEQQYDASMVTKLKSFFGDDCCFIKFVFAKKNLSGEGFLLNEKSFNYFGKLKNHDIVESLQKLDLIVDFTYHSSVVKKYVLKLANQSYKIAMGDFSKDQMHLSVKVNSYDIDVFMEEIFKYHKILSHDKVHV